MARYAPGLNATELRRMTPEETRLVSKEITDDVKRQRERELEFVKALIRASGARLI
jgi:hypothetical protein